MNTPSSRTSAVPQGFTISSWEQLEPHLQELVDAPLGSVEDLGAWLVRVSDWEALIYEERAWRHIKVTCHTMDQQAIEAHAYFNEQVLPPVTKCFFRLLRKAVESPFFAQLPDEKYSVLKRTFHSQLSIFREENVDLLSQANVLARQFDRVMGSLSIEWEGERYTLPRAVAMLESEDRELRKAIWKLVADARAVTRQEMHQLLDELLVIRAKVAANAGFDSFTDYSYRAMERHDYGTAEAEAFRHAIATVIRPLYEEQLRERAQKLGLERLQPYDLSADLSGAKPLAPFSSPQELAEKSIRVLQRVKPEFAAMISEMRERGLLDLDSRLGKAPGGYNYPLPLTGAPFIFMNASGTWGDVVTMLHEAGHAVQAFLMRPLELYPDRHIPSEIAELASMSMELICLDALDEFYPDPEDLRRAQLEQLNRMVVLLPWIATVDHFQHWLYDNPNHSAEARNNAWREFYFRYHGDLVDWAEDDDTLRHYWQRQGHIYRSPFYYIEYGIAQLGAVAVWRNYRLHPEAALRQFADALSMGYSKPIPEVYQAAGIRFDFSAPYIQELMDFAAKEIRRIKGVNG